jgi:hypothetical protein
MRRVHIIQRTVENNPMLHEVNVQRTHHVLYHKTVPLLALGQRHKEVLGPHHREVQPHVLGEQFLQIGIQRTRIHVRMLLRIIQHNDLRVGQIRSAHIIRILKVPHLPVQAVSIGQQEVNRVSMGRRQELAIRHNVLKAREGQNKVRVGRDSVRVTTLQRVRAHREVPTSVQRNARVRMRNAHRSDESQS